MGVFFSAYNGRGANKVLRQTSELNTCLGVEIYFIFRLRESYQNMSKNTIGLELHCACRWQQSILY